MTPFPDLKYRPRKITNHKDGYKVNIMSYNLLACGLDRHNKFPYASEDVLNFWYRAPRIINEIQNSNADIVCLQEINHVADFYSPEMAKIGY